MGIFSKLRGAQLPNKGAPQKRNHDIENPAGGQNLPCYVRACNWKSQSVQQMSRNSTRHSHVAVNPEKMGFFTLSQICEVAQFLYVSHFNYRPTTSCVCRIESPENDSLCWRLPRIHLPEEKWPFVPSEDLLPRDLQLRLQIFNTGRDAVLRGSDKPCSSISVQNPRQPSIIFHAPCCFNCWALVHHKHNGSQK